MERLLYSSSPSTMKFHSMRFDSLHRCGLIDPANVLNYPSSLRPEFRPLNWISSQYVNSSPALSHSSPSNDFPSLSDSEYSAPRGSVPESSFFKQIAIEDSGKRKVARTFIIFSALIMILIQPAFEAAAKTGNPVTATSVGRKLIQNELFSSAWTGFFAGCLHTLSGPDHLAALAPLSIGRTRMESVAVGALWGCGHDAGQLIFGLVFLLLKDQLHIEIIRTWGTRVVGATLLVIGALGFKEASESSSTPYETLEEPINGKKEKKKNKIGFATFATGIVHGLQPDALMMVLPALALPSRVAGAAFLVMFLVGTVVAMGSYTVVIGSCSEALKDRVPRITEKLTWASSFVAIALGFAILTSQFFGYSLY